MKMKVSQKLIDDLKNNKWLRDKYREMKNLEAKELTKFLDENPDFMQVLINLAQSPDIEIIV